MSDESDAWIMANVLVYSFLRPARDRGDRRAEIFWFERLRECVETALAERIKEVL